MNEDRPVNIISEQELLGSIGEEFTTRVAYESKQSTAKWLYGGGDWIVEEVYNHNYVTKQRRVEQDRYKSYKDLV